MRKILIIFLICFMSLVWFARFVSSGRFQTFLDNHPHPVWAVRAQYTMSMYHYMRSHYKEAVESDDRIIKIYPKSSFAEKALLHKARSYLALGNKKKAVELYELFMKTYPDSEQFEYAEQKQKRLSSF
ncbi:MAG: tetratricopeptide repeat protein [bacterium]